MSQLDRIRVECDFRAAANCRREWEVSRRAEANNRGRNLGQIVCMPCSRLVKYSGRRNPNCKYPEFRDDFFAVIDCEAKAYLLGWVASDGCIRNGRISIDIQQSDRRHLEDLKDLLCADLPVKELKGKNLVGLCFGSKQMVGDVCRWLSIEPGKKSDRVGFPALPNDALSWAFVRGYFDGDGSVSRSSPGHPGPRCSIATGSSRMRQGIKEFCGVPCREYADKLEWYGNNALDFLARLYANSSIHLRRKYDRYLDWCLWVPGLSGPNCKGKDLLFRWQKTHPRAVPPFKERASDSGYDLTLIEKVTTNGLVELFTTGLKVQPDYGWYFDLVPRSSIVKTGYIIANSVGVIDRTYKGPVLVPLIKVDASMPDLTLPCRLVQLIPRPIVHVQWLEVEELDETGRGDGGFGSTGDNAASDVQEGR
jgi:deoxyuridine 5'-triphosphate nucleotidohydrolase